MKKQKAEKNNLKIRWNFIILALLMLIGAVFVRRHGDLFFYDLVNTEVSAHYLTIDSPDVFSTLFGIFSQKFPIYLYSYILPAYLLLVPAALLAARGIQFKPDIDFNLSGFINDVKKQKVFIIVIILITFIFSFLALSTFSKHFILSKANLIFPVIELASFSFAVILNTCGLLK